MTREEAAAEDVEREAALAAYITQMAELVLDRDLLHAQSSGDLQAFARALTLTVLRRLDGERKATVVRFLLETELLRKHSPAPLSISGADLSGLPWSGGEMKYALLEGVDLAGAELDGVFLGGNAILAHAILRGADLSRARARGADFTDADLRNADLRYAELSEARLIGAQLSGADLRGADLTDAVLTDQGFNPATYDATTQWPDGYDPVAYGAPLLG